MNTDNHNIHWIDIENDHNSSLSLKPSSNLELLVNQFIKYYDIEEIDNIKIHHKNKALSLFHINACSLKKKILMTFSIS